MGCHGAKEYKCRSLQHTQQNSIKHTESSDHQITWMPQLFLPFSRFSRRPVASGAAALSPAARRLQRGHLQRLRRRLRARRRLGGGLPGAAGDATRQAGAQRVHGQRRDQRVSKGAEVAGGLGDLELQVGKISGGRKIFLFYLLRGIVIDSEHVLFF